jgi:hypothetical protein
MRKILFVGMVVAMALVSGACSSDDSDDAGATTTEPAESTTTAAPSAVTAEDYNAAFMTSLTTGDPASGVLVIPVNMAECLGPRFVDIITLETLQENNVTLDEAADPDFDVSTLGLTEAQGQEMAAAFAPCGLDLGAMTLGLIADDATPEQLQCATEHIDSAKNKAMWAKSLYSTLAEGEFEAVVTPAIEACDLPAT